MELVFRHPEGKEYGGVDVGVGGDRYEVAKEGSRQIIRGVPNSIAHLLEPHHWYPSGVVNADIVEVAAREAMTAKRRADNLKLAAEQADQEAAAAQRQADDIAAKKARP